MDFLSFCRNFIWSGFIWPVESIRHPNTDRDNVGLFISGYHKDTYITAFKYIYNLW